MLESMGCLAMKMASVANTALYHYSLCRAEVSHPQIVFGSSQWRGQYCHRFLCVVFGVKFINKIVFKLGHQMISRGIIWLFFI